MKHRIQRRSNIFLMEIILSILFFSIASAICIRLFAQAHMQSEHTAALNQAVLAASSAAEALETCGGAAEELSVSFPYSQAEGQTLHVYYDSAWKPCVSADTVWQMDVILSDSGGLLRGDITVSGDGGETVIYTLTTEYYRGNGS